jgi:hypothetical protein
VLSEFYFEAVSVEWSSEMKMNYVLGFLLLAVTSCTSAVEDHDHDHSEHDGGHTDHISHVADAGVASDATDAGTVAFELPRADEAVITLAGEHSDDYSTHVVTTKGWSMYETGIDNVSEFKLLTYSNRDNFAIAMNSPDNAYNPGAYSRFDWVIDPSDVVHYCQTRYDAASAQEAYEATPADAADLTGGCGTFAWTALTATTLDLVGNYSDNYGTEHDISLVRWLQTSSWTDDGGTMTDASEFTRLYHSNQQHWLVAENHADNAWNTGLFSRFDWVDVEGQRYFCQTTYEAASAKAALELAAADSSDPATAGCGSFAWSSLTANN